MATEDSGPRTGRTAGGAPDRGLGHDPDRDSGLDPDRYPGSGSGHGPDRRSGHVAAPPGERRPRPNGPDPLGSDPRAAAGPADDAAVPAWWRALGLPGLADVHVHFLPERLLARIWEYFDASGPLIGRDWPIHYRLPEAERLERLRAMGVRAFTSLVYAHRPGMAAGLNTWAADFAARTPGCLPTATFFPEDGVAEYVRAALTAGAAVFKVHLQVGGYDPRDPLLDPVWGLLAEAGVPAVVHAGSGPVANGFTGPEPFGAVLARHPRLPAIIAHLGAPEFDGFFDLAARYDNVRLDTTMTFTDFFRPPFSAGFPERLRPVLRDLGLSGRILLGTDFPNIPYAYAHQLDALARLGFGDDWLRAVCWDNTVRLFAGHLEAPPDPGGAGTAGPAGPPVPNFPSNAPGGWR